MGKEENQQIKEELRKKRNIFRDIKIKFNKWRFNMYLCAGLYILFFFIANWIIKELVKPRAAGWLVNNENLVISLTAIVLGICFIADSIVTSYLKTPLQRLALNIDISPMEEKKKNNLMRVTQETNELFKETFKKFGILVIPVILTNIIDKPQETNGDKRSEHPLFYICYLIPILFATWRIWQVNRELNKIEQKILNEQKKHYSN
ncbi:hypothetical protein [endosymbiont GvMRE of Glomus versiforme]|uniref:hypothetical protein n=1 Tax=endosymbiont GvMRE of Glomus versiforme TaxID=2039283 RepID=UPI000EE4213F|nr:hypothetical protein [endosymbiont GvMRE of Glomus versiforme]RHZ37549.1 hypothetical protein GvMRE_I1g577 [endosymbiont GvMRE of Glomus versiforme]